MTTQFTLTAMFAAQDRLRRGEEDFAEMWEFALEFAMGAESYGDFPANSPLKSGEAPTGVMTSSAWTPLRSTRRPVMNHMASSGRRSSDARLLLESPRRQIPARIYRRAPPPPPPKTRPPETPGGGGPERPESRKGPKQVVDAEGGAWQWGECRQIPHAVRPEAFRRGLIKTRPRDP